MVLLFMYFGTMRLKNSLSFFSEIEKKIRIFWSPKGPPFNLFDILLQTWILKKPEGSRFYRFKTALFEPQI